MNENLINCLESEKRHFTSCAILALGLMLFMGVGSTMDFAQAEQVSMRTIASLSAFFLVVFVMMVHGRDKKIEEAREEAMAQLWKDWYNS